MHTGFKNLHDFLTMGGYAAYVWSAYAVTLVVMVANIFSSKRRARRIQRKAHVNTQSQT